MATKKPRGNSPSTDKEVQWDKQENTVPPGQPVVPKYGSKKHAVSGIPKNFHKRDKDS